MTTEPMSLSRQKVREFVKLEDGAELQFEIAGTEVVALKFVQAMRVELSRMRGYVKRQGRAVRPFTLSLKSIIANDKTAIATITIWKKAEHTALAEEVSDIFKNLDGGAILK